MSKSIRAACAKLLTVELATSILIRTPQASSLLPGLLWLKEETHLATVALIQMTKRPVREFEKVEKIIGKIKAIKDESPKVKPHGEIYLAFAIALLLGDLLEAYNDPVKKALIEPLHECAMNIEAGLDKDGDLYDAMEEADEYLRRVYLVIDG